MKNSTTLRRQSKILLTVAILVQSVVLTLTLIFSGMYNLLDAEAFRLFESVSTSRLNTCNNAVKKLVKNTADTADALNKEIIKLADNDDVRTNEIYLKDAIYKQVALISGGAILDFLNDNEATGGFVIFTGSNVDKKNHDAHSAVYIRNMAQGVEQSGKTYELKLGTTNITKMYNITSSADWDLDWRFDSGMANSSRYDFYSKPLVATQICKSVKTEQYGYWNRPFDILDDGKEVITYTVPLLDKNGEVYGIFGAEISTVRLINKLLMANEMPYNDSFTLITAGDNKNGIVLDWYISDRPVLKASLNKDTYVDFEGVSDTSLYLASLDTLGSVYCSNNTITMYGKNAVFADDAWEMTSFVSKRQLNESSNRIGNTLMLSIVITSLFSLLLIDIFVKLNTRKIEGLSRYIEELEPYQEISFSRSGLKEIDDLMTALEKFSKDIINTVQNNSRIFDMTSLPIGGFEIREDIGQVIVTNYVREILGIRHNSNIPTPIFDRYYKEMTRFPMENDKNIYEYTPTKNGAAKWLRIIENDVATGKIGVILDVSKDIKDKKRLAYEAEHDSLTGLYNRSAFSKRVSALLEEEPEGIGAMVFADLDNLKFINDSFGHDAGDQLIKSAADMFLEFEKHGGIVARISGDEFVVYLHGTASKTALKDMIYREIGKQRSYTFVTNDGNKRRIRASAGIAWYPDDARDVIELIKLADYAMYEIKHSNKGGIAEFDRKSYEKNIYLLDNRDSIIMLLEKSLIRFDYQPIVDLKTGDIFAYEMLMRSTIKDFKSPLEILEVVKAQSRLGQLERVIIFKAFESIRENQDKLNGIKLFVNSIPSQILSSADLDYIKLNYSDLFSKIVIEIIEAETNSDGQLSHKVNAIRSMGMQLAIDDFGSGYSNEMRILSTNPDIIKLDMEMVQGIHKNADKRSLVENIIRFCKNKNVRIVAEGIEEVEDLITVKSMGVDFVQGYYAARPNREILDISEEKRNEIINL